jgi:hypothetical protein
LAWPTVAAAEIEDVGLLNIDRLGDVNVLRGVDHLRIVDILGDVDVLGRVDVVVDRHRLIDVDLLGIVDVVGDAVVLVDSDLLGVVDILGEVDGVVDIVFLSPSPKCGALLTSILLADADVLTSILPALLTPAWLPPKPPKRELLLTSIWREASKPPAWLALKPGFG